MILAACATVGLALFLYAILATAGTAGALWLGLRISRLEDRLDVISGCDVCQANASSDASTEAEPCRTCHVCGGPIDEGECEWCGMRGE